MNLGFGEMLFIFILAMIIFGPKKLPEIGRQIGKALSEFKRASNDFKAQLESEMRQMELEEALKKEKENFAQILQAPAQAIAATGLGGILNPAKTDVSTSGEASSITSTEAEVSSNAWASVPAATEYAGTPVTAPGEAAAETSSGVPAAETAAGAQENYVTVHPSPWDDAAHAQPEIAGTGEATALSSGEGLAGTETPTGRESAGSMTAEPVNAATAEPASAGVSPWRSWSQGGPNGQTAGDDRAAEALPDAAAPDKQNGLSQSSAGALSAATEPGKESNA